MIRSFVRLIHVDAGIDADRLLTFKIAPAPSKYANASLLASCCARLARGGSGSRRGRTVDAVLIRAFYGAPVARPERVQAGGRSPVGAAAAKLGA